MQHVTIGATIFTRMSIQLRVDVLRFPGYADLLPLLKSYFNLVHYYLGVIFASLLVFLAVIKLYNNRVAYNILVSFWR